MVGWLTGWRHRKRCTVSGCTGAGSNYQFPLTVYYGAGTDSGTSVYLDGLCQLDFGDVRFTASDGETLLSYWVKSQTDGTSALIWVKDSDSLETDNTIYLYYDNPVECASLSSQTDTFTDVLTGVLAAWQLDEDNDADAVVDYSGNGYTGTPTGRTVTAGKFTGKNASAFGGDGDKVTAAKVTVPANNLSVFAYFKRLGDSGGAVTDYHCLIQGINGATNRLMVNKAGTAGHCEINDGVSKTRTPAIANPLVFNLVGFTWDGANIYGFVNNTFTAGLAAAGALAAGALTTFIGIHSSGLSYFANGVLSHLTVLSSVLTQANINSLNSNYPDATLDAGKVLVRKYVYPEPAPSSWGEAVITEAPVFINARTQWIRDYRRKHLPEMKLLTGLLEYYKTQREENKN